MTEAATETPTLTEVLVPHAIYQRRGINCIAIGDDTLQVLTSGEIFTVTPQDVILIEEPGNPSWVNRMASIRGTLISALQTSMTSLRDREDYIVRLGEALRDKAIELELCGQYDIFAREWNLPGLDKDYMITMNVRVRARSEEAAVDIVQGKVDLQTYNTEGLLSNPDFDAEEI